MGVLSEVSLVLALWMHPACKQQLSATIRDQGSQLCLCAKTGVRQGAPVQRYQQSSCEGNRLVAQTLVRQLTVQACTSSHLSSELTKANS